MDDVKIAKILQNEPFVDLKETKLIEALKETVQSLFLGPIHKYHIIWLSHVTSRHGLYYQIEITFILWDCPDHFV